MADKIAVIDRFLEIADVVMIGGAMCFPFLCAQGHAVGDSLCDEEDIEHAAAPWRARDRPRGTARVELPERPRDRRALRRRRRAPRAGRRRGARRLDGPRHRPGHGGALRATRSRPAGTVFWNGPMGAFELEPFAAGTRARGRGGRQRAAA